jgi:acyl-CoA reductase-like NAD-dependent aldehyde dehydrogenase
MNKRTVVLPDSNTHVTFTAENIADAMKAAAAARARGDEWQARNAESFATMVAHVLDGGDYYYSGIPSEGEAQQ